MAFNPKLKEKIRESLAAVLPITGIVLLLSIFLVPLDTDIVMMFFAGAALLILGMGMFQLGAEMAMTPIGDGIGEQIAHSRSRIFPAAAGLVVGIFITIAEPDLSVLSGQVPGIPNRVLILSVAVGVGIFLAVAILRILLKIHLANLLAVLYAVILILAFFVPENFLAVAFDSGGVTTGPITVPFIMALGVGLSSARADKDAASDSFGLVALSSVGPILAVMLLGCVYPTGDTAYSGTEIPSAATMREVARAFADELPHYAREVLLSLLPIAVMYVVFQLVSRRYKKRQRQRIAVGYVYTYLGLVLFLCGVNVGFAPVGSTLGRELAGSQFKWLLIPIGMLIGYFIVKAEPAIQILNRQVQDVTDDAVSAKAMNLCLSIGVSVSVGLAMLRVLTGIPLIAIVVPGYLIALLMSRFVPKMFVGIAFDSGGVASGPMASTFLLPLCIGASQVLGGNVMTDAFGVVSLVALTPLIAVQIMGLVYRHRLRKLEKLRATIGALPADSDEIVELEEES